MIENEDKLIEEYGVLREQKTIYIYKGYKYDYSKDAINYAKRDRALRFNSQAD